MIFTRTLIVAVLCLAFLVGCGSGGTGTGAGGGSGGTGGGSGSGGGADGGCNTLVNNAPTVSKTTHAGPPPTMDGGTLMDGTWFLTSMDRYNGSTGSSTHKETWVFSGNTVQIVTNKSTDAVQKHFSATYSTAGSNVTLTVNCPMTATLVSPYTATATMLQVINSDDPLEIHTFTRQ